MYCKKQCLGGGGYSDKRCQKMNGLYIGRES